jgi:hypothetical protein
MSNNELKQKDECCYNAWRKSEAHQCPMTQDGMKAAEERYKQFKVGWDYAITRAMLELEKEHSTNKKTHSFFNISKNIISKLKTR